MRLRYFIIGVCFTFFLQGNAQDISGFWLGRFKTDNGPARILLQVNRQEERYMIHYQTDVFADKIFRADSVRLLNKVLFIGAQKRELFRGSLVNDTMFKGRIWFNKYYPCELKKITHVPSMQKPQTPLPPFSYFSRLVSFVNNETKMRLTGVLTIPKDSTKKYPAVILLSGSGKNDMDYTFGSHKPFSVLADFLTKKGIIVLRLNERGVRGSGGVFETTSLPDFVSDTRAAIQFLLHQGQADSLKIGLIGHSEGGLVAPLVAIKDSRVKYIVNLAGPAVPYRQLVLQQLRDIAGKAKGSTREKDSVMRFYNAAIGLKEKYSDTAAYRREFYRLAQQTFPRSYLQTLTPAFDNFIEKMNATRYSFLKDYDPQPALKELTIPILGLFTDKDILVNGTINYNALQGIIGNSPNGSKVLLLKNLNHNFQHCIKCDLDEPIFLEETLAPEMLHIVGEWILDLTGK